MKNSLIGKLQILTSIVAVVLIAIFAFTPLMSIPLASNQDIYENSFDTVIGAAMSKEREELQKRYEAAETEDEREAIMKEYEEFMKPYTELSESIVGVDVVDDEGNLKAEYDDEKGCYVDEDGNEIEYTNTEMKVSLIGLAKSIPGTIKFMGYWFKAMALDTLLAADDSEAEAIDEAKKALFEDMDPEAVNEESVNTFRLLFSSFISMMDTEEGFSSDIIFKLLAVILLTVLKTGILLIVLVLFPLSMLFTVIGLALGLLNGKAYKTSHKKCKKAIVRIGAVLTAAVVWGASFTALGIMLLVVAAAVLAVNVVASRLKSYSENEKKFLNIMQLTSAVSAVGIALFAIFFAKADLLNFYASADVIAEATKDLSDVKEIGITLAVIAGMCAVSVIALRFVFKGLIKLLTRAACMGKGGGSGMSSAVLGIIIVIANFVVSGKYNMELTSDAKGALIVACVGAVIALAGGIALTVLRGVFVPDITAEETAAVFSGMSSDDEEADED